jgi:hypothetical protein
VDIVIPHPSTGKSDGWKATSPEGVTIRLSLNQRDFAAPVETVKAIREALCLRPVGPHELRRFIERQTEPDCDNLMPKTEIRDSDGRFAHVRGVTETETLEDLQIKGLCACVILQCDRHA